MCFANFLLSVLVFSHWGHFPRVLMLGCLVSLSVPVQETKWKDDHLQNDLRVDVNVLNPPHLLTNSHAVWIQTAD